MGSGRVAAVIERLGSLFAMRGLGRDPVERGVFGDIVGVAKLKGSRTNDTLVAPGEEAAQLRHAIDWYGANRNRKGMAIELAIRLWAQRDPQAARAVKHIDRVRLGYYAKLYAEMGLAPAAARNRAFLFYASLFARAYVVTDDETDVGDDLAGMLALD